MYADRNVEGVCVQYFTLRRVCVNSIYSLLNGARYLSMGGGGRGGEGACNLLGASSRKCEILFDSRWKATIPSVPRDGENKSAGEKASFFVGLFSLPLSFARIIHIKETSPRLLWCGGLHVRPIKKFDFLRLMQILINIDAGR